MAYYQPYLTGNRVYNGSRSDPNGGMVDPLGYKERDAKARLKRSALLKRMQAGLRQDYLDPAWLKGQERF